MRKSISPSALSLLTLLLNNANCLFNALNDRLNININWNVVEMDRTVYEMTDRKKVINIKVRIQNKYKMLNVIPTKQ